MSKSGRWEDDGLHLPEVGQWSDEKYRQIAFYSGLFSKAMKGYWSERVYVDLFAGAGLARVRPDMQVVPGTPLLALGVEEQFDRYIFCEASPTRADALEARIAARFPESDTQVLRVDVNREVNQVVRAVTQNNQAGDLLALFVVDPFALNNVQFSTIRLLAEIRSDFIVLIPAWMDGNRNILHYFDANDTTLDTYLGQSEWRERWYAAREGNSDTFGRFIGDEFTKQMRTLGFEHGGIENAMVVRNSRNSPLYYLVLYSRHPLAERFWNESRRYAHRQTGFDF